MGSESTQATAMTAAGREPAAVGAIQSSDGSTSTASAAVAGSARQRALGERIRKLRSGEHAAVVQRQVMVGQAEASFQNIHDENGNPFLRAKTEDGSGKIWKINPDADLQASVKESKDGYHVDYNDETRDAIHKNLSLGRHMELKSGDMKFTMLPFKSYLFKKSSEFEIAQWNEHEDRAPLYSHHRDELMALLKEEKDSGRGNEHLAAQFTSLAARVMPTIIAEQQRFIAYRKEGKATDFIARFNKLVASAAQRIKEGKSLSTAVAAITTGLKWAGGKGKKNQVAALVNDGHVRDPAVSSSEHQKCGSPMKREEKQPTDSSSPIVPIEDTAQTEETEETEPIIASPRTFTTSTDDAGDDEAWRLETSTDMSTDWSDEPSDIVTTDANSQPSAMLPDTEASSEQSDTSMAFSAERLKKDPLTKRLYVNYRSDEKAIDQLERHPVSVQVGGTTYRLDTPILRGGSNWYRLNLRSDDEGD